MTMMLVVPRSKKLPGDTARTVAISVVHYLRQGEVMFFVCFSVCLLATSYKNYGSGSKFTYDHIRDLFYDMSWVTTSYLLSYDDLMTYLMINLKTISVNLGPDFQENATRDASLDTEQLIEFWKSSAPESGFGILLKAHFQHCEMGHFSTIWLIALE